MFCKTMLALSALLMATGFCFAQQETTSKPELKKTPIKRTNPASGKEMFVQYCAPCHGTDAKGNGPAAAAMKTPPPDHLTQLAKKHDGKFPATEVAAVLKFGNGSASHGSEQMPVWGPLFQSLDKYHAAVVRQRTSNLVSYMETLQAK
jgi:mono/diheme cytochrome c family protein